MHRIQIYDTTLRDGSQGEGVNFSLQDKLLITAAARRAWASTTSKGAIRSRTRRTPSTFSACRGLPLKHAKVCAFGMTRRRGVQAGRRSRHAGPARVARRRSITIVGKTSDFHVTEVLRVSLEENLAMIADSVALPARARAAR